MAEAESARGTKRTHRGGHPPFISQVQGGPSGEFCPSLSRTSSILGSASHWGGTQQVLPSHRGPSLVTCRSWPSRQWVSCMIGTAKIFPRVVLKQTYPHLCAKRRGIGPVGGLLSSETIYGGPSLGMWDNRRVVYPWVYPPILPRQTSPTQDLPQRNAVARWEVSGGPAGACMCRCWTSGSRWCVLASFQRVRWCGMEKAKSSGSSFIPKWQAFVSSRRRADYLGVHTALGGVMRGYPLPVAARPQGSPSGE